MAKIQRFEDMEVWQRARAFAKTIFQLIQQKPFCNDWSLKDQIDRSSGSIMDNIAEGFERGSKNEFVHYLSIAKGSAGETRSQLYRAKDRDCIDLKTFNDLTKEAENISKQLSGFIDYVNKSLYKGVKYKDRQQVKEPEEAYGSDLLELLNNQSLKET